MLMERLIANINAEVLPEFPQQDFHLCPAQNIESLVNDIVPTSEHFGLLLAIEGQSLDSEQVRRVAKVLIQKGLASFCVWGPDCERIHDLFDAAAIELDPEQTKGVIMTTWHDDEPLEEAISYFMNCAIPDEAYQRTCRDWIFAPVASSDWERIIRGEFEQAGKRREN